jgi:hypothetical protein
MKRSIFDQQCCIHDIIIPKKGDIMNASIEKILNDLAKLEDKLHQELDRSEKELGYKIKNGLVEFEQDIRNKQKKHMKTLKEYFKEIPFLHLITSPIIYAMIFPAIILDISLFLFQQTIFRLYKFKLIKRSDYIVYDRHLLNYLNPIEKLNCIYCSYFNGLSAYTQEIAAQTELYFCPIKHAKRISNRHSKYKHFLNYGDADNYQEKLQKIRDSIPKSK